MPAKMEVNFVVMQFIHVSGQNGALREKHFFFTQNCYADVVSDLRKKLPYWP